jgi:demethylmenaquinone methyltransferase/2-methoxy-6-polyprenyl-1,4-benzoquinol methylase
MPPDELDSLVSEQIDYYRARAPEYDRTVPYEPLAQAELRAALRALAPYGSVLELACGTGQWTVELADRASSVTAVDASPEMIAINQRRVADSNTTYEQADLFSWTPARRYDLVFFSDWLSHVPPQRFEAFWALVDAALRPAGHAFFIDELPAVAGRERILANTVAPAVERPVGSGERYRAIKVFYEPAVLRARLAEMGWDASIRTVGWRFYYGVGVRST